EARKHPRIPEPPLHVSGERVTVLNISLGGIALLTGDPLEVGSRYELILTDAWHYFTNELCAEVVWCKANRAGLEGRGLSQEQQRWLEVRFEDWLNSPHSAILQIKS